MFEDDDFDTLENLVNDERTAEPSEEMTVPVIIKNSWSSHNSKFTRKISQEKAIFQEVQGLG